MREAIEQILDGTYDYEKGALSFSCTKLEIELQKGETYEGSFTILASEGKYTVGYVSATDPRMECLSTEIHGNQEEIAFRFHGEWMEEGEVTRGEFQVVSNKGEYYLPFVVSVMHGAPKSSIGPVRNLLQFTNLARTDWQEAVKIFYTPAFAQVLKETGNQLYLTYQGLAVQEGNGQHVEEFLVAANKKQRIEYLTSEKRIFLENPVGIVEQPIHVFRNGWGHTRLEVWCDGEFLFVEKNVITEDDFLGNQFTLPVYVDTALLHQGRNMGKILLKSVGSEVEIPITILNRNSDKEAFFERMEYKKYICNLVQKFQELRLEKISKADWLNEITRIVERMVMLNEKDVATRLFQAHLLITKEQVNEAGWILEHVGELMNEAEPTLEAYYLYLNSLYQKEEGYTGEMNWQVDRIYHECGNDWRVAWLLLFMSEEYNREPMAKWNFLKEQFENGCRSPLIYLEALLLLNQNPTFLRKPEAFELQVLHYGKKQDKVSLELVEQVVYLSERIKDYQPLLYTFLTGCYEKKADERVLKEICTQLIKGNRRDKSAFEWFAKGVEAEIRITNLYEYYMMSMDLEQDPEIPKQVLLYFTYQTNLDYLRNAYLYYYVTKRERTLTEIYTNYRPRIQLFVKEQVLKGRINRHLAGLYRHFLSKDMLDGEMARCLSELLFAHEIRLERKDIKYVIVCQSNHLKEQKYAVTGNRTWIPLYGKANSILFEDYEGYRYAGDVAYVMEELILPKDLLEQVISLVTENPALDIYLYGMPQKGIDINEQEIQRWIRLSGYEYLPDSIRGDIVIQLLKYYGKEEDNRYLVEYLSELDGSFMSAAQRGEVVRQMVLCDCMDMAYNWYESYGNCKVDDKILLHLLETQIERELVSPEGKITLYAYRLLEQGTFSGTLLNYLMVNYKGLLKDLRKLWNASKSYKADRKAFCERFLVQVLFSGYYVSEQAEIFKELVFANGDEEVIHAYLCKHSYESFALNNLIQPEVLLEISRLHSVGKEVPEICRLAYLKYYAENREEIQKEETYVIRDFLDGMLEKGIRLNCLMDLRQYSSTSQLLMDRSLVEYHADAQSQPIIHYLIIGEDGEVGDYMSEPMNHVMGGIFVKEFILFFGESLQYYIVEAGEGEGKLTQSGTIQRSEMLGEELPGRYGVINDIIISKTMQDYNTFDNLLEEYYRNDFYNQELFKPRK